eukprot:526648-Hanusia_phi.AAC.1
MSTACVRSSQVIACGDDRKISEFVKSATAREVGTPGMRVQQLLLSNNDKILFAGTAEGLILSYIWGVEGLITEGPHYVVARGNVTRMATTPDDCILFVTSEDGTVFQ